MTPSHPMPLWFSSLVILILSTRVMLAETRFTLKSGEVVIGRRISDAPTPPYCTFSMLFPGSSAEQLLFKIDSHYAVEGGGPRASFSFSGIRSAIRQGRQVAIVFGGVQTGINIVRKNLDEPPSGRVEAFGLYGPLGDYDDKEYELIDLRTIRVTTRAEGRPPEERMLIIHDDGTMTYDGRPYLQRTGGAFRFEQGADGTAVVVRDTTAPGGPPAPRVPPVVPPKTQKTDGATAGVPAPEATAGSRTWLYILILAVVSVMIWLVKRGRS